MAKPDMTLNGFFVNREIDMFGLTRRKFLLSALSLTCFPSKALQSKEAETKLITVDNWVLLEEDVKKMDLPVATSAIQPIVVK